MTTLSLEFPTPLTEKYRPTTIDDFVGISEAKHQARFIVSRPIPNTAYLFCGESGTGKTTMALAIAKALDAQVHHIPARQADKATIERVWDSVHYTNWTGSNWHVVICDEADFWRVDLQQMFLSILDSMGSLEGTMFGDWRPSAPQVIWIFTTNQDHKRLKTDSRFEPRFLSRVRIVPFSSYGMANEIRTFLETVWHAEGGNGNGPDLLRVAKEARNNIRECLNVLESSLTQMVYNTPDGMEDVKSL